MIMRRLVEEIKEFINNTPPNELAKAWEHVERFKNVGPTVNQFILIRSLRNYMR